MKWIIGLNLILLGAILGLLGFLFLFQSYYPYRAVKNDAGLSESLIQCVNEYRCNE